MFDSLTGRLGAVFDRLKRRGALTETEVEAALRAGENGPLPDGPETLLGVYAE